MRRRRPQPVLLGDPGSAEQLAEVSELVCLAVASAGVLGLVVTAIVVLAPHPPVGYHPLAIAVASAAVTAAAVLGRRRPAPFSPGVLAYVLPVTIVAVAAGALLAGPVFAPLVTMFFIWYATSITFMPRRAAIALMVWAGVVYGGLLALQHGNLDPLIRWEATVGIMVITAVVMDRLVERSWALARGERAARAEAERAHAEIEAVSADKSRFLARMSHELRTPLNAIIGFSEVLFRRSFGELNPKQAEYVGDVVDSGRHLLSLVDDVLDLAKVETGRVDLDAGRVDLAELLAASLALFEEQAGRRQVTLALAVEPRVATIEGDARKLRQVVFNLLANAVRFTPAGGWVALGAHRSADRVRIWVSDTGPGIVPEDREAIFEEFRQGAGEGHGGTGLGLPLARRLVELHGGRLGVESEIGAGSTFTAELPVHQRPRRAAEDALSPADDRPARLFLGEPDSPGRRAENARLLVILGRLCVVLGALVFVTLRLHPPPEQIRYDEFSFAMLLVVALGISVAAIARPQWMGAPGVLPYVGAFGIVVTSLGMDAMGLSLGDFGFVYLIGVIGVFLILTLRQFVAELALIGVCYALILTHSDGYAVPVARWVAVMGFLTVTGLILRRFVARIEALALAERAARDEAERARAELEQASRHKTEFLANMSHELRTPLNVIIGFSEVLASQAFGPLNEKQVEYVDDVLASGRHLLALINDILDLAKADAGRMELRLAELDLEATLASALLPFQEDAAGRRIDLRLEVGPGLAGVEADEAKLVQAIGHLVSNASKFTPEGGRVTVGAAVDADHVDISVADTGRGVDPADHDRIFHAFAHADDSAGTGLGLALARRYAELHGGSLTVRSDVGRGAVFTLRLPRQRAEAEAAAPVEVA